MQNINNKKSYVKNDGRSVETGIAKYYIDLAANIILLYFFNNIIYANIPFLANKSYISCLWAINLALAVGIIGNFILLLYRPRWFHHLVQAVLSALIILAAYIVYRIFPFTFNSDVLQTVARTLLLIIMAGTGIGLIVEVVKFSISFMHREPPGTPPVSPLSSLPPEPPASD